MTMTFKPNDNEEAYEEYDAYAALNRQSLLRKPFVPYIAAGVVALVVILGFTMYSSNSQNGTLSEDVALLTKRLDDIEFRLGNLEQTNAGDTGLSALRSQTESLSQQVQNLETKLGQNLNQINAKLAVLEKSQKSVIKAAPAASQNKTKAAKPRIHVVKAGETLYQISRKYGVTVDQLKKFNNMGKDVTIRPGQELVVGQR
jgi:LysM repeat protein